MKYFAGLDISLEETAVCVIDEMGGIVRETKVPSEPQAIVTLLQEIGVGYVRIGLEPCPLAQWIYDGLVRAGLPTVCVELRRLKAALAGMINKTDRNDARGIAQVVRTGWFQPVHVKSARSHELKMLLSARRLLLDRLHDIENELRGSLKVFGLKIGAVSRRSFEPRVHSLVEDRPWLRAIVEPLLRARASLLEEFTRLHKLLLDTVRNDSVCRRLMTVPGVGAVVALTFKAAVDVPARFRRSRAVGAHFGLTPRRYQSGEIDRTGRISKTGDRSVRSALYEAANVILSRQVRFSALKAWAVRLARRVGANKARVALARKLAVILHRLWIDGTSFQWTAAEPAAQD